MIYGRWRDIPTRAGKRISFSTDVNVFFFAINETLCSRLTRVLPHCWGNPFPRLLSLSLSALEQLVSDRDRWLLCYVYSFVTRHSDWLLCVFFSEELVGTCSDTSSNNLLKSVHHHYRVRSAVVCREWERGSENWRLNGRRSAAGSDSTRWKKSSSDSIFPGLFAFVFSSQFHSFMSLPVHWCISWHSSNTHNSVTCGSASLLSLILLT